MSETFTKWQEGDLTDIEALRGLWSDLNEVESEIGPLEKQKTALRDEISQIVARTGTVELKGFGKAMITNPTITQSYDKDGLDELVERLKLDGYGPIAEQILQCRKKSLRSGGLRIEKEKK